MSRTTAQRFAALGTAVLLSAIVPGGCNRTSPAETASDLATRDYRDCLASQGVAVDCPLRVTITEENGAIVECGDEVGTGYTSDHLGHDGVQTAIEACEAVLDERYRKLNGWELAAVQATRSCLADSGFETLPGSVSVSRIDDDWTITIDNATWHESRDREFSETAEACSDMLEDILEGTPAPGS